MTQEFHLSVTPVGPDTYLVRTERMAAGVPIAEEQVTWSPAIWLQQARQALNDPVLGILTQAAPSPGLDPTWTELSPNLIALGQELFGALFQGRIRDSWMAAQSIAQNRRDGLRLRLGLPDALLQQLPWEVLHDGDRPLATGTEVVFSRYWMERSLSPFPGVIATRDPQTPLRILMVIATPSDQERLELQQEFHDMQQELTQTSGRGWGHDPAPVIQMTLLDQPGRAQLTQALEQGHYHIVHYAGHSTAGAAGGSLCLVNDRTGLTEYLAGDDLAGLLVNNGVQMAVLNSCRGAYHDPTAIAGGEQNLAQALLRRGVPAVLAMAERIPDEVALTLSQLFYRNLKQGAAIDLSLSRARQGLLSAYGSHQLYWALPVLYLHPEFDGRLASLAPIAPDLTARSPFAPTHSSSALMPNPGDAETGAIATSPAPLYGLSEWDDLAAEDSIHYWNELATAPREPVNPPVNPAGDGSLQELMASFEPTAPAPPSAEAETVFSRLIQQLSSPGDREGSPEEARAAQDEDLLSPSSSPTAQVAALYGDLAAPPRSPTLRSGADRPSPWSSLTKRRAIAGVSTAVVGIVALLLVSTLAARLADSQPGSRPDAKPVASFPLGTLPATGITPAQLTAQSTRDVIAIALTGLRDRELAITTQAVTELLDREALPQAGAVLLEVPEDLRADPRVNFLQGRLAWQQARSGHPDYQAADAQRFWTAAVRDQPDDPQYLNALAFAHYEAQDYAPAAQYWLATLAILQAQQGIEAPATVETMDQLVFTALGDDPRALTAYAGLALTSAYLAQAETSATVRQTMLAKASKLSETVFSYAPQDFTTTALAQNWLWTERAIVDWQALPQRVD